MKTREGLRANRENEMSIESQIDSIKKYEIREEAAGQVYRRMVDFTNSLTAAIHKRARQFCDGRHLIDGVEVEEPTTWRIVFDADEIDSGKTAAGQEFGIDVGFEIMTTSKEHGAECITPLGRDFKFRKRGSEWQMVNRGEMIARCLDEAWDDLVGGWSSGQTGIRHEVGAHIDEEVEKARDRLDAAKAAYGRAKDAQRAFL